MYFDVVVHNIERMRGVSYDNNNRVETEMDRGWLCVVPVEERTERNRLLTRKIRERFLFFLPIYNIRELGGLWMVWGVLIGPTLVLKKYPRRCHDYLISSDPIGCKFEI